MNSPSFNYPAPSSSSPSSSSSYSVVSPITTSSTSSVITLSPKESLHDNTNNNNNYNNNNNNTSNDNSNNNNIDDEEDKNQTMPSFLDGYDVFEHLLTQQDLFSDDKLVVSLIPSRRNSLQDQMEIAEQQEKNQDTLLLDNQKMIKILDKKENIVEKDGLFMDDDQSSSMKKDKNNHHHGIMDNIHSTHEALLPTSMITNRQHHHHHHQNQQQQQQQQQVEQQQVEQQQRHQQRQQRQHRNRIRVDHDERSPIWEKVTEHAENNKFNIEHLLEAVKLTTTSKRENKSLVDEWELESMIQDLNYYL
ncbi:hypothetical protein BJ944DRAFT_264899 [Cunninghamella echinulata]|nr:hypothetical protein BJ944DRAFT_264899 [Cunninghamella echinulata]